MTGLARDGGLYVPESWPQFSAADLRRFRHLSYADLAEEVMRLFVAGSIDASLRTMFMALITISATAVRR